jgi:hypothetical protein
MNRKEDSQKILDLLEDPAYRQIDKNPTCKLERQLTQQNPETFEIRR